MKTLFYAFIIIGFAYAAEDANGSTLVQPARRIGSWSIGSSFMQQCMREHGIERYFNYFEELSRLPQMPDELKITRQMVMIPYFAVLCNKTKEEQRRVFDDFVQDKFVLHYPLWRLFLAALWYSGVGDAGYILCTAIENKDTSLVRHLLEQGVDVNSSKDGYTSLWWCSRLQEAKLLVQYGANVALHYQKNDLLEPICAMADPYDDTEGTQLMHFYLQSGLQLNKENNFGYNWFRLLLKDLSAPNRRFPAIEEKLTLLWQAGRYSSLSIGTIEKHFVKYVDYPIIRQLLFTDIVGRLQQRSLTGNNIMKIKPIVMKRVGTKKF